MKTKELARVLAVSCTLLSAAGARAGFPSTEVFLPAVGRLAGQGGAQFYTTVWASNLTAVSQTFTFQFLRQGQANPSPASFQDTLSPGQTKTYENVVESKLGLSGVIGAARITSTGEIFVSERIFNQAPGTGLGETEGLFFAAVPKSFSISAGQSASIQGLNQGGAEDFRYNFALVETGGASASVDVQVFDGNGALLGQKSFPLLAYDQIQPNVAEVVPGFSSVNARLTATVTGGSGTVLLAGAQLANGSQDSSGFEMSFRDSLLAASGSAGVASLNGLTGALTLKAGSNVTITPSGSNITIAAAGGGGAGFALPFSGTTTSGNTAFSIANNGSGSAIEADAVGGIGVHGVSTSAAGVYGRSTHSIGVVGQSDDGVGVHGFATNQDAVAGDSQGGIGIHGTSSGNAGVRGESMTFAGVVGLRGGAAGAVNAGVIGAADVGAGVYGFGSPTAYAIYGQGDYGGTGMKSFVEPHPTDPTREIRYVCLEGPEAGTYFRGTGKIQGGSATIEVPESFRMVTADRGLTVVAMPMNEAATLVCTRKSLDTIVIRGSADVEFDYVVNGVRRSYADFQPVSENVDFVPRSAGDTSLVRGLPEESIRRLKANGILNDDGTINVDTARRLGWDRRPEWRSPAR